MTQKEDYKKTFWTEASKWGLIAGLGMCVIKLISGFISSGFVTFLLLALQFILLYTVNMKVGRKMSSLKTAREGFTFGQAFTVILATMFFAGIIYGAGEFIQSRIDPSYFNNIFNSETLKSVYSEDMVDMIQRERDSMMPYVRSPFTIIIAGIMNMCLLGGMVGILNSALLRRPPMPE